MRTQLIVGIAVWAGCNDSSTSVSHAFGERKYAQAFETDVWHGQQAPKFPFVVAVGSWSSSNQFTTRCSGVAIAPDAVLTAGHCVKACGDTDLWVTDDEDTRQVAPSAVRHVTASVRRFDYRDDSDATYGHHLLHDLAVLRISGAKLTPWSLERVGSVAQEDEARKVGYGWSIDGATPFRGVRLRGDGVIDPGATVELDEFRFDQPWKVCEFDSGGGTFTAGADTALVGITSMMLDPTSNNSAECSDTGLDTAVAPYLSWIQKTLSGECTCSGC